MYEFALTVWNTANAPWVVSMSYGWAEYDQCYDRFDWFLGNCTYYNIPNSKEYVIRTNQEFIKLGLRGHTLLAASGDDGTAGMHGSQDRCETMGPLFPGRNQAILSFQIVAFPLF